MISCKRATELVSRSMEESLSIKETLELRLHNFLCEFCHRFELQVDLMRRMLRVSSPPLSSLPDSSEEDVHRDAAEPNLEQTDDSDPTALIDPNLNEATVARKGSLKRRISEQLGTVPR